MHCMCPIALEPSDSWTTPRKSPAAPKQATGFSRGTVFSPREVEGGDASRDALLQMFLLLSLVAWRATGLEDYAVWPGCQRPAESLFSVNINGWVHMAPGCAPKSLIVVRPAESLFSVNFRNG